MQIQPYLFFNGRTEEALMHACVRIGDSEVMASDAVQDKFGLSWMLIAGQKNTAPPQ
jgi:uncharacterized glyoxalase superfamily protein PhnB